MSRMDEWITVKEASDETGLTADWIRKLCRADRVASQRFGKAWMVNRQSLSEYIKEPHKTGPKPRPLIDRDMNQ